jgi:hypothetical protein
MKGDPGVAVEVMIFSLHGAYVGSLKGTADAEGITAVTLTGGRVEGKVLATGVYWALVKGGGVTDKRQFAVVARKGGK